MPNKAGSPDRAFLSGGGALGALMRAHDWSNSPLGHPETWPQSLRSVVGLLLNSKFPMFLAWGPELGFLYNDSYAEILGAKHPQALGRPFQEVWSEIWSDIAPLVDRALAGEATFWEDLPLTMQRKGYAEQTWFTFSYSPARDESGTVAGVFCACTETTRKVLAERQNADERERLTQMFSQAPGFMAMLRGPDHVFELANHAYQQLIGHRDVVGKSVREALPELVGQGFFELLDGVYQTGEPFAGTSLSLGLQRVPGGAAEERFVDFIYQPVMDGDGRISGIFVEGSDVTERVRGEAALRESEARFRNMADSAPVLIWMTDAEGRVTFANMHYDYVFGRPASDMLGGGWAEIVLPEDLKAHTSAFFEAFHARAPFATETRVIDKQGRIRWLRCEGVVRTDDQGTFLGYTGCNIDITDGKLARDELERRVAERTSALTESERRFRAIFDSAYQFMALLTPDGTVVEVNRTATRWSAVTADDIVGKPFWRAAPMRDNAELQAAIEDAVRRAASGEVVREEHEMRGPDDLGAVVDFSLKPVLDEEGRPSHLVAEGRDVTEQKRNEEQLRQAQKMEAVGQLTGGVAHDFNNLLTIIRASTDLLRRPDLPEPRRRRYIEAIADTVDRAAKLTGQLLAFARRQALAPETFDVGTRVRSVAEMLDTLVGARIRVETHIPDEPSFVKADSSQFETALINMAVNARDAMNGEGTLTLRVAASVAMPPLRGHAGSTQPFVAVSIADTGSGIPRDSLPRIFEPFFTTKEVGKGTGLGLSQVFGFAKQSGGDVAVESESGVGTTFTLYLPKIGEEDGAGPEARPSEPADPETGAGRHVLVVEDNVDVGTFATQILQDLGYRTTWAANADEALGLLAQDPARFDIMFTDVVMPGMSGIELGHEVRRRHPGLPIVLTSGYSHVLAEEGRHGFDLVHKPYSTEALLRVLGKAAEVRNPRA
jgi:PAS domain S-box-containing protein